MKSVSSELNAQSCLDQQTLMDWLLGKTSSDVADAISSHVSHCDTCRDQAAAVSIDQDQLVSGLRSSLKQDSPDSFVFEDEPQMQRALGRIKSEAFAEKVQVAEDQTSRGFTADDTVIDIRSTRIGQYLLLGECGHGGMGTVYRALHSQLEKTVALKILPRRLSADRELVARFEREMKAVGRLDHPNIVRATDAGYVDGIQYLALEFVEGCNAADLVAHHGRLSIADACEIGRQAAIALTHAHEHGLIHRDVKPSNLMVTPQGDVKLLDLGLARLQEETSEDDLTVHGQIMGTIDYMAPEQAESGRDVDDRSDLWGLGATLYKLLTGRAPFQDELRNTRIRRLTALTTEDVRLVQSHRDDLPDALSSLVGRLLSKNPDERPASAANVAQTLEPFCASAQLSALVEPVVAEQNEDHHEPAVVQLSEIAKQAGQLPEPTVDRVISVDRQLGSNALRLMIGAACVAAATATVVATIMLNRQSDVADRSTPADSNHAITEGRVEAHGRARSDMTNAKPDAPKLTGEPNRDAADYVRRKDGDLRLSVAGKEREWPNSQPLPKEPFEVVAISFSLGVQERDLDLHWCSNLSSLRTLTLINEYSVTDEDLAYLPTYPNLTSLTLYGVHISDDGMRHIAELKNVQNLSLRMVSVGDDGLQHLQKLHEVTELCLAGTDITNHGLKSLSELTSLTSLDLRGTQISDAGIECLQEFQALSRLRLGRDTAIWGPMPPTPITGDCVEHLAQLQNLKSLHIEKASLPGASLSQLPNLTTLEVGDGFTDSDLLKISASIKSLQFLNLTNAHDVTDEGLSTLNTLKNLQSISLAGTAITDAGLDSLTCIPHLKHLSLSRTLITDRGLPAFYGTNLQSLSITDTDTSYEAFQKLQTAVPQCRVSFAGTPGQTVSRLFDRGLVSIDVEVDGETRTIRSADAIPNLPFRIRGKLVAERASQPLLDRLIQSRPDLQLIHGISVRGSSKINRTFLHALADLRHLKILDLSDMSIGGRALTQLRGCRQLEALDLSHTRTGDDELIHLLNLPHLATLSLEQTRITDQAVETLKQFSRLRSLNLINTNLTDSAFTMLKAALPDCEMLR